MTTQDVIRWGILGTGWVAAQFAQDLKYVPDARLEAVASRSLTSAQAFAQKLGAQQAYSSYDELVAQENVDVVYIATPHTRHHADCMLALNAGKPVLCEKPFMMNTAQASEVFDLAQSRQLFCMEAMWMRFVPLMQQVRQRIQQGEIGDVKLLTADFGYPVPFDPTSRFFNPELGGGALLDRGVYPLSLAVYLLGCPAHVTGEAAIGSTGVDEQSAMILKYDTGAIACLSSTLKTYASNQATVFGTCGKIVIEPPFYYPEQISITRFPDTRNLTPTPKQGLPTSLKDRVRHSLKSSPWFKRLKRLKPQSQNSVSQIESGRGYHHQAAEVARCLRAGLTQSPDMTWEDSLTVMNVIDQLRSDWATKAPVTGHEVK